MARNSAAIRERAALCDLFGRLGPHAPTLCEGWTTLDLAAHLFVRERRPVAALGLLGGSLGGLPHRAMARVERLGYERLVERLRTGPPFPLRPVDHLMNLHEFFVHHEDVRRATSDWERRDDPRLDDELWTLLRRSARFIARRIQGVGLLLERPDGDVIRARKGAPAAVLRGTPQEVVLYLFGRRGVADVETGGDPGARAVLEGTDLSA